MGAVRAAATKHGHYSGDRASPTLKCWDAMVQRCTNPNATGYALYGGAGVMVCERWLGEYGFVNFLADMGERPSRGHSLDRYPNAHGNYEPGNVRWATHQEQMLNRPGYNRVYTLNGETMCHAEWARRYGISDALLRQRLKKWPLEVALTKPVRQSAPRKNE